MKREEVKSLKQPERKKNALAKAFHRESRLGEIRRNAKMALNKSLFNLIYEFMFLSRNALN